MLYPPKASPANANKYITKILEVSNGVDIKYILLFIFVCFN